MFIPILCTHAHISCSRSCGPAELTVTLSASVARMEQELLPSAEIRELLPTLRGSGTQLPPLSFPESSLGHSQVMAPSGELLPLLHN